MSIQFGAVTGVWHAWMFDNTLQVTINNIALNTIKHNSISFHPFVLVAARRADPATELHPR